MIRQLDDLDGRCMEPLPLAEKKARRDQLTQDLPGLDQKGLLAVSDGLVDRFARMVKAGELLYVPLEECVSLGEETAARWPGRSRPRSTRHPCTEHGWRYSAERSRSTRQGSVVTK